MDQEKPFHILIIEDSPDDRADIRRMLLLGSDRHFKFSEAKTGADALRQIREAAEPPSCVLLDFSLPDMDALEILSELRGGSEMTLCPVVVLTGSIEGGANVIPAGAQDYLGKGWASPEGLTRAIQNAVERYALMKERMHASEALRASEEFNRMVLHSSPDCVKVLDKDGVLLLLNEPGRCLLEIDDTSTVLGQKWWTLWPKGSQNKLQLSVDNALKGQSARFEEFCPTAKGNPKWWDVFVSPIFRPDGSIDRIVAVSRDVTESRYAQQMLQETTDRLTLGLRVSGVSLAHIDYLADTTHLTAEAVQLYGLGDQELTVPRETVKATFHPEDRDEVERKIVESQNPSGLGYFAMEHRVIWPDGDIRWLRVQKKVFFAGEGISRRPVRAILAAMDITDKKRTEIQLSDSGKRKDEFLAMLAHELRNPLAPMLTGMEVLLNSSGNPQVVEKIGGMMKRQINHMAHLIDDLLDVSRISSGKIELQIKEVILSDVIRQAVESVMPLIKSSSHELVIDHVSKGLILSADYHRLTQILSNLLSNAAKYTPAGGKIVLSVAEFPGKVKITVEDNGNGISPDHQLRIFDLFDQGSVRANDGLGIGLTLVKSLVEMHDGNVSVHSKGKGHGSKFTVELPDSKNFMTASEDNKPIGEKFPEKLRVLVADDGKTTADILGMFFNMEGMDAQVVYDGEQAIRTAADLRPHLACLDLGMPVVDGYEAARKLREISSQTYIVALSGWGSDEDRQRTADAGFHEHLVKPVNPDDLRKLLGRVTTRLQEQQAAQG